MIDQYRFQERRRGINEPLPNDGTYYAEAIPSTSVDALAALLEAEKDERLMQAWSNLTQMQMEYISARLQGLSNNTIAIIHNISKGGVKSQVSKGMARLRKAIQ